MLRQIAFVVLFSATIFGISMVVDQSDTMGIALISSKTPTPTPISVRDLAEMPDVNSIDGVKGQRKSLRTSSETDRESIAAWRKLLQVSGLHALEQKQLEPDEVEIRVWQVPGLYAARTKCWIFSRKTGIWIGSAIVDREFNGKLSRAMLGKPAKPTDWDNFINLNFSPKNLIEASKTDTYIGPEGDFFVVEIKSEKEYERRIINDEKFLNALFKKIKSEFFMDDDTKWGEF